MENMKNMKNILYGVSNFKDLINDNAYYIDKTMYIERLEKPTNKYAFFFRPRRFGKSLFLSTLEYYYDIRHKDKFEQLFGELYIGKNPTPLRNSFPILSLDFSEVNSVGSLPEIKNSFNANIWNALKSFTLRYPETFDNDPFETDLAPLTEASDLFARFNMLLSAKGVRYYLIIDEYDNFANNILAQYGKDIYYSVTHGTGFLRTFFNVIKVRTKSSIARIFATGVTPLVLSDVTSGFNIGDNISTNPDFHGLAGFTAADVQEIVENHIKRGLVSESIKEPLLSLIKKYCDGYLFIEDVDKSLYNSTAVWHIMKQYHTLVEEQKNRLPRSIIDSNLMTDYKKLEFLVVEQRQLNGNFSFLSNILVEGYKEARLVDSFAVNELTNADKFSSFLYYLGLLTMRVNEYNDYIFSIPNQTCAEILWGYIRSAIHAVYKINLNDLMSKFSGMKIHGHWRPFFEYLLEQLFKSASVRDFITKEAVLKGFLIAHLNLLDDYDMYSEYELNKGIADVYLVPNLLTAPKICPNHYILELKYLKKEENTESNLAAVKAKAAKQLNQYAQDPKLKGITVTKLIIIVSSNGLAALEEVF
jgi:hypothetical protein